MLRLAILSACALLVACGTPATDPNEEPPTAMTAAKELIVVAAPRTGDPYYAEVAADIFDFHIAYAKSAEGRDDFLVLTYEAAYPDYAAALGEARVLLAPQDDIWMRDFSLSNAAAPMMFRYTAEGQGGGRKGQSDADHVLDALARVMEAAGVRFAESDLLNDGGNFVDDYDGRAVVSRKFLRDNGLSEDEAREALMAEAGLTHVAFIAPNVLVINSYPDDPAYAAELEADLRAGLPGVTIHRIVTPYDGSAIYDDRFGSACGLYTNMLVTPDRIYLQQFGIPEDEAALQSMRSWTAKEVVPVRSEGVCRMGGGVRCMCWQLRGANAAALKAYAAKRQK